VYDGSKGNFESSMTKLKMYAVQAGLNEFLTSTKPTDLPEDGDLNDFSGMRLKTKKKLKKLLMKHTKTCFMLKVWYPGSESQAWWARSTMGETDSETALLALRWPQGRSWLFFRILEKMHRQQTYMDYVTVKKDVLAIKMNPREKPDLMFRRFYQVKEVYQHKSLIAPPIGRLIAQLQIGTKEDYRPNLIRMLSKMKIDNMRKHKVIDNIQ